MKKLAVLICIIIVIMAFPFSAAAADMPVDGSKLIPQEILAQLPLEKGDRVFPMYFCRLYTTFAKCDSIDDLELVPDICVVLSQDETFTKYEVWDGVCSEGTVVDYSNSGLIQAYLTDDIIRLIDPNIQVSAAYILFDNDSGSTGSAVYYKTNLGDFVYHSEWHNGTHLFSLEAFLAYQRAIYREAVVENMEQGPMIGGVYTWLWDLSAYDFTSEDFDPYAKFPLKEKDAAYLEQEQLLVHIAVDLTLLAGALLVALILLRMKKPEWKIRARWFILAFAVLTAGLLLWDCFLQNGVLVRDFASNFLTEGMPQTQVEGLVGSPESDANVQWPRVEYDLPFGHHFYLVYTENSTVQELREYERTYPLRGWLLPALLGLVALLELAMYLLACKLGKRDTSDSRRLVLRLLVVFLCVVLAVNVLDHYVFRAIFPELYVRRGMTPTEILQIMGKWQYSTYSSLEGDVYQNQWDLFFRNTLTVTYRETENGSYAESCHISGLGDPTDLTWFKTVFLAAVAAAELLIYRKLRRQSRNTAA